MLDAGGSRRVIGWRKMNKRERTKRKGREKKKKKGELVLQRKRRENNGWRGADPWLKSEGE